MHVLCMHFPLSTGAFPARCGLVAGVFIIILGRKVFDFTKKQPLQSPTGSIVLVRLLIDDRTDGILSCPLDRNIRDRSDLVG